MWFLVEGSSQFTLLFQDCLSYSGTCAEAIFHINFKMHAKLPQSCLTLCNPMDVAFQAPLSMGFSRQEYCCRMGYHALLQGITRPKDRTHSSYVSCISRWVLYQLSPAYFYEKKKLPGFLWLVLNLLISLRRIDIFTILSLPTHEHGISLHLIGWSLISFITNFSIQILYMFCKVNR